LGDTTTPWFSNFYLSHLDKVVKSPSLAFLLHGKQKVRFLLSSQINDLRGKSLICVPVHGRVDDFLRSHHLKRCKEIFYENVNNIIRVEAYQMTPRKRSKAMKEAKGLKTGDQAPGFSLKDQEEERVTLADFSGSWLALYFYPRDNTPGCTTEALDFTSQLPEFKKLGAVIVGISPDSPKSHRNFIQKRELRVTLLSDPEHKVLEAYGVWRKKKMAGREYMGVVRTTFLIDPRGRIAHTWPRVKVKDHAKEVQERLMVITAEE